MPETGWQTLGQVLGAGRSLGEEAYQEGRYRTAQTEGALELARQRQLENVALESQNRELEAIEETLAAAGDPNAKVTAAIMRGGRGNAAQLGQALLSGQEYGFRGTLGDPNAPRADQFAAGQGVQGKVLPPFEPVGAGGFVDMREQEPEIGTTPLGESMIAENVASELASTALANLRDEQRTNPAAFRSSTTADGRPRPPSGYIDNPNFDPAQPISDTNRLWTAAGTGGPHDPTTEKPMGAREAQMFNRVIGGAKQAQVTLGNLVNLPVGASAGFLGLGSKPGQSIFTAVKDNFRNTVASQDVQTYNSMLAGLERNLAFIEGHGLAASDTFAGSYDNLTLREGDTEFTRLHKLAEIAQTIEAGLDPYLVNPRVPEKQKQYIRDVIEYTRQAIPFDHNDVTLLERTPGAVTLGDLIKQKGLDQGAAPAAPAAPEAGAPAAAPEVGAIEYDENGVGWQFGGGDPADPNNWYQVAE